jgi:hypothetical protein
MRSEELRGERSEGGEVRRRRRRGEEGKSNITKKKCSGHDTPTVTHPSWLARRCVVKN